MQGIYRLDFSDGQFYIGQQKNIEQRLKQHIAKAKLQACSKKLQAAFDTCGIPKLTVLQEATEDNINELEDMYIESTQAVLKGLNTVQQHGNTSQACGENHGRSSVSNKDVCQAFEMLLQNIQVQTISKILNISETVLYNISSGRSHTWLKDIYGEEYVRMISTRKPVNSNREYKLIDPTGALVTTYNLSQLCRDNNLQISHMSALVKGTRKQHKKWKAYNP